MENPYASPPPPSKFSDLPPSAVAPGDVVVRGLVGHVRVIAILMIVQAVLQALMGLYFAVIGVFLGFTMGNDPAFRRGPNPPPEWLPWVLATGFVLFGVVILVSSGVMIWAGIRSFSFRSRKLNIIALIAGSLSVLTCYCAPTSIGLLVYGLIVYLNPSVKQAFEMGDQGLAADQIDAAFNPYAQPMKPM